MGYVRHTVHHDLKRNRDLLLHLLGGDSRPLRDDLNVIVRDVGISLNGKSMERGDSPDDQQEGESQNEEAFVQGKVNYSANHYFIAPPYSEGRVRVPPPGCCRGAYSRRPLPDAGSDHFLAVYRPTRGRAGAESQWPALWRAVAILRRGMSR